MCLKESNVEIISFDKSAILLLDRTVRKVGVNFVLVQEDQKLNTTAIKSSRKPTEMENFQIEDTEVVLLDHEKLINESYNTEQFKCDYILNPKLFEFHEREHKSVSKRRRKKPMKIETQEDDASFVTSENILGIEKISEATTNYLRSSTNYFNSSSRTTSTNSDFRTDFLEENRSFISIKGRNENASAHITEIPALCKITKFLIPAKSAFFNSDVLHLSEYHSPADKYDLIIMDPPWRNKYIRRVKRAKEGLGYKMMSNDRLADIPLSSMTHAKSLVVIWCTNSAMHQTSLLENLLPAWNMKLLSKWYWVKLNTNGKTVCEFQRQGQKQPFEVLFIATHNENTDARLAEIKGMKILFSVPSIVHSHKPPILEIFRKYLPEEPKCLELFARYLQPYFTSVGLEVLKLMDLRLYNHTSEV